MVHSPELIKELEQKAMAVRKNCISIFEGSHAGHVGGTLSIVELITSLYFHHMKVDPKNPDWEGRDRLILSKAHTCEALYAAFAEIGWIKKEQLKTYYHLHSPLQGHADRWATPGIDFSGGSLGLGISHALGSAIASSIERPAYSNPAASTYKYPPKYRVYCILGDGECHEGQVWEAAMAASTYKADNLIAIVDYNKYCIDGPVNAVIGLEPFAERWKSFGWWVTEINGHDIAQIVDTLDLTDNLYGDGKPKCIIAHTVKGKGIDYWEARHSHIGRGSLMEEGLKEGIAKYYK